MREYLWYCILKFQTCFSWWKASVWVCSSQYTIRASLYNGAGITNSPYLTHSKVAVFVVQWYNVTTAFIRPVTSASGRYTRLGTVSDYFWGEGVDNCNLYHTVPYYCIVGTTPVLAWPMTEYPPKTSLNSPI